MRFVTALAGFGVAAAISMSAQAADPIGEIEDLDGSARASGPGGERALDDGDDIFLGDTVMTDGDSAVEIEFDDDTVFNIGEGSSVTIDEFVYTGGAQDKFGATLTAGVLRFVSGSVAKIGGDAMSIGTPIATIGVRGTTAAVKIEGETGEFALLEPDDDRPTAIRVSNEAGAVTVDQPNYVTRVPGKGQAPTPPEPLSRAAMENLLGAIRAGVTAPVVMPSFGR